MDSPARSTAAPRRTSMPRSRLGLPAIGLAALPAVVSGADLTVRVVDGDDANPVEAAAVCLGTLADPSQLGGYWTPADGRVVFTKVPRAPLVLTISKSGYRAQRRRITIGPGDQIIQMVLPAGGGEEFACDADTQFEAPGLTVTSFRINHGAAVTARRRVTLDFEVSGDATEYRAGESPDLTAAQWRSMEPAPSFELSPGPGSKTVYLQVRRRREAQGARLETQSEVVSDTIRLR